MKAFAWFLALGLVLAACSRSGNSSSKATLRINEIMSRNNDVAVLDARGEVFFLDWVEVVNTGTSPLPLAGYTLSDDLGDPRKFRFPAGATMAPGELLVILLVNRDNCVEECEQRLAGCLSEVEEGRDDLVAVCDAEFDECARECAPVGMVADFGLGGGETGETVYLFADGGETLIDRLGVRNQPADLSFGRYPDGVGRYGILYVPTPGAPNHPVDAKPARLAFSAGSGGVPCDEPFVFEFSLEWDSRLSEPEIGAEFADVDAGDCLAPLPAGSFTSEAVVIEPLAVEELLKARTDVEGELVEVSVLRRGYRVTLPGAPCETIRRYRVSVGETFGVALWDRGCFVVGDVELPTLVVNEYMPRNETLHFQVVDRIGECEPGNDTDEPMTLDWFELYNFGDEPVDVRGYSIITLDDALGPPDPDEVPWTFDLAGVESIDPGCHLLLLTDRDRGTCRRVHRFLGNPAPFADYAACLGVADPADLRYFSTDFGLDATPAAGRVDGFVLRDNLGRELDRVEMDFSNVPQEFRDTTTARLTIKENVSVGRNEVQIELEEGYRRDKLKPGVYLCQATPGRPNTTFCEVPPRFRELLTVEPLCPGVGESVVVTGAVNFDLNSVPAEVELFMDLEVDSVVTAVEVPLRVAPDQSSAAAASTLYDFNIEIPAQEEGAFVVFSFRAVDRRLGIEVLHDESTTPTQSLRYVVGFTPPADAPVLNEVLPRPADVNSSFVEYAEIFNPRDEELDISGYYLTQERIPELAIRRPRQWRFPEGSVIPPRGHFLALFDPVPEPPEHSVVVEGLQLDCREVLYLIGPDDPARGANCVIDGAVWDLRIFDDEIVLCEVETAVGHCTDGCDVFGVLPDPSPGAANNCRLPQVHSAFHEDILGNVNTCVREGSTLRLNFVVLVDSAVVGGALANTFQSVEFFVDRGEGEERLSGGAIVERLPPCPSRGVCATSPPRHTALLVGKFLLPPYGSVVSFRGEFVDRCGRMVASDVFSVGTLSAEHPELVVNEVLPAPRPEAGETERWIELLNVGDTPADLGGVSVTDDTVNPREIVFPTGVTVEAGGLVVINVADDAEVELGGDSGAIQLVDSTARGSCLLDTFTWSLEAPPAAGSSLGRVPDGSGPVVELTSPSPGELNEAVKFVRGDVDESLTVDITDMIRGLAVLFGGDPRRPRCEDALDADDDGSLTLADPVFVGNFLFRRGKTIPPPYPEQGLDPTADDLPCR